MFDFWYLNYYLIFFEEWTTKTPNHLLLIFFLKSHFFENHNLNKFSFIVLNRFVILKRYILDGWKIVWLILALRPSFDIQLNYTLLKFLPFCVSAEFQTKPLVTLCYSLFNCPGTRTSPWLVYVWSSILWNIIWNIIWWLRVWFEIQPKITLKLKFRVVLRR